LGCESGENGQLPSTSTIVIVIITQSILYITYVQSDDENSIVIRPDRSDINACGKSKSPEGKGWEQEGEDGEGRKGREGVGRNGEGKRGMGKGRAEKGKQGKDWGGRKGGEGLLTSASLNFSEALVYGNLTSC